MNRSRKDIAITEPTEFDGGNNRFMNAVNPNMLPLTLGLGSYHGWKQNGAQIDPDDPPANITILKTDGWRARFAGPNHTQNEMGQYALVVAIREDLEEQGGEHGLSAWVAMCEAFKEGLPTMTITDFRDAYIAKLGTDNLSHYQSLLAFLKPHLPDGWGYEEVRDWFKKSENTLERLLGGDSEIVEVIS